MAPPSSATPCRVQGGLRGGPRRLIWLSGWLFIVSVVRCACEDEMSASLAEWRHQHCRVEPHARDRKGASEAGGGGGQEDSAQGGEEGGRSASLAEWTRQRNRFEPRERHGRGAWEAGGAGRARGRPCGGGEHTDGRSSSSSLLLSSLQLSGTTIYEP